MGQNARKSLDRGVNRILKGVIKKRRPRDTRRRAHQLEHLEDRRLLAADVMWAANTGILEVSGSGQAETISIATENGSISVDGIAQGILAANVNELRIEGGDGNDVIDIRQLTGLSNAAIVVMGGAGNDTLLGSPMNDQLQGGEGDDYLEGFAGDDNLIGGAGADTYVYADDADLGNDAIDDSGTLDTLDFSNLASPIDVDLSSTTTQTVAAGGTLSVGITMSANSISGVIGTPFDDNIEGNSLDNQLVGGAGADALVGKAGADTLDGGTQPDFIQGGPGDDIVIGGGSNDSLYGDSGDDHIIGAGGNDLLAGGLGADTLEGDAGSDVLAGSLDEDTIIGGSGQDSIEFLDDADSAFQIIGDWGLEVSQAISGAQRYLGPGAGAERARWSFEDLPVDNYEVFATWQVGGRTDLATNTPFALLGGTEGPVNIAVDQSAVPNGPTVAGQEWHSLGFVHVANGMLDVEMGNHADGVVLADAVRIAPVGDANQNIFFVASDFVAQDAQTGFGRHELQLNKGPINVSEWTIDWGDGTTEIVPGSAEIAAHSYESVGRYEVSVVAQRGLMAIELASQNVVVDHAPGKSLVRNSQVTDQLVNGTAIVSQDEVTEWTFQRGSEVIVAEYVVPDSQGAIRNAIGIGGQYAGGISQELKTVADREYVLTMSLRTDVSDCHEPINVTVTGSNGNRLASQSFTATNEWSLISIPFTGDGSSSNLLISTANSTPDVPDPDCPVGDPDPPPPIFVGPNVWPVSMRITEDTEVTRENVFNESERATHSVDQITSRPRAQAGLLPDGTFHYQVGWKEYESLRAGETAYDGFTYIEESTGEERAFMLAIEGVNDQPQAGVLLPQGGIPKAASGAPLILETVGAWDVDNDLTSVTFFRESDSDGILTSSDEIVGFDYSREGGWTLELEEGTWESESPIYYAVASDSELFLSSVVKLDLDSNPESVAVGVTNQNLILNGGFENPPTGAFQLIRRSSAIAGWNIVPGLPPFGIHQERTPLGATFSWEDAQTSGSQWAELDVRSSVLGDGRHILDSTVGALHSNTFTSSPVSVPGAQIVAPVGSEIASSTGIFQDC
jgi:hypothetical protein